MKKILYTVLFLCLIQPGVSPAKEVEETAIQDQIREISKTLRCAVCQSESIWESNAELARQMRDVIRERLEKGETPEEIRAYFLSRYGDYILLKPRKKGLNWLLWLGPFLLLLSGGVLLYWTLGRWVRETHREKPASPPSLTEQDRKRIDQALQSHRK